MTEQRGLKTSGFCREKGRLRQPDFEASGLVLAGYPRGRVWFNGWGCVRGWHEGATGYPLAGVPEIEA